MQQLKFSVPEITVRSIQYCFIVLVVLFGINLPTGVASAQSSVTIDETMPAQIPDSIANDWEEMDNIKSVGYKEAITKIADSLTGDYAQTIKDGITSNGSLAASDPAWKTLYLKACHYRRVTLIKPFSDVLKKLVFAIHYNLGGYLVGYQECVNMWSTPSSWNNKSALCLLQMDNYYSGYKRILDVTDGVVQNPCVSFDGKKILYARAKGKGFMGSEGFHLFEMDPENPTNAKQLTSNPSGLTVSDYEPCYLPNGDIVFVSSRCFGNVDCSYNYTSNLFICNQDGKYLRRIGYDQVHTFYPQMMSDGSVMYTRWEYNDRILTSAMGYFQMNPDGTHQTELFGNQTMWPMTMIHGRQIPNSFKIIGVASGHWGPYAGELFIADPNIARNGLSAVQLVAPIRQAPKSTGYGGYYMGDNNGGIMRYFQNPWPLDEKTFIVSWRSDTTQKYDLYVMNVNFQRELLAWDQTQSCSEPYPLAPRKILPKIAPTVDYAKSTGTFTMQNVYYGTGMTTGGKKPADGSIKKLRIIALDYRVDTTIGEVKNGASQTTPIARYSGSWECKRILGETPIAEDGSAAFIVPARTPVYFQAIDSLGQAVQTMRSWSTLQPGEQFPCYGCHEDKNTAPPPAGIAKCGQPKELEPFYDIVNKGFNYRRYIQPIWDKNCVTCHDKSSTSGVDLSNTVVDQVSPNDSIYSSAKRHWVQSYITLTQQNGKYVNWIDNFEACTPQTIYHAGASKSKLVTMLRQGHHDVRLTKEEMDKICCWIDLVIPYVGFYDEGFSTQDSTAYEKRLDRKRKEEALEETNIQEFIKAGQYGTQGIIRSDRGTINKFKTGVQGFSVRFSSFDRSLVLRFPSKGEFLLHDLAGRKIMNFNVKENAIEMKTISANLPSGLYIAKFKGEKNTVQQMISVVQ